MFTVKKFPFYMNQKFSDLNMHYDNATLTNDLVNNQNIRRENFASKGYYF